MKTNIEVIKKNEIKSLKFPKGDVLKSKSEKISRFVKLHKVFYSGSVISEKVKIVFSDDTSFKKVEATIIGLTSTSVILRRSAQIPLTRIVSVA